jgi:hypothetical protein
MGEPGTFNGLIADLIETVQTTTDTDIRDRLVDLLALHRGQEDYKLVHRDSWEMCWAAAITYRGTRAQCEHWIAQQKTKQQHKGPW